MEEAKKAFKVAEITYSNKLIDIMSRKEFEVVEKLCSYMFAQANFFHEGYEALSKLEPTMRQMMNTLVNAQNDYLVGKNQFNIEDVSLPSFFFPPLLLFSSPSPSPLLILFFSFSLIFFLFIYYVIHLIISYYLFYYLLNNKINNKINRKFKNK